MNSYNKLAIVLATLVVALVAAQTIAAPSGRSLDRIDERRMWKEIGSPCPRMIADCIRYGKILKREMDGSRGSADQISEREVADFLTELAELIAVKEGKDRGKFIGNPVMTCLSHLEAKLASPDSVEPNH